MTRRSFQKLTGPQLDLLRPLGRMREVEVDEVPFRDGASSYDPMVVLAGRVAVLVGGVLETSVPDVFAVGDVRSGGTRMAAPAVGEGGMAVRFAAEHLARTSGEQ